MLEQVQNVVMESLLNIVLGLIALGSAYATLYLRRATEKLKIETKKIEDEKQRYLLDRALSRLEEVASKTVNKIEQTTAKQLRKAVADGKVDRKELESLAIEAYEEIIKTLEPEYLKVLNESLGDAEVYIKNTIEEKVREVKQMR
ncbi:hypothetical protein [Caloranaerobacter sp. DY30410]|uniref:hypothetical protein n=1 Tax=Caloranaerobacter sp. DY30410 TaxID=3238305 RepID=UPI003D07CB6A